MKATQLSIDRWMDKENVVYTYDVILCNLKKEGNPVTCYSIDEPRGHYDKQNKPVTKEHILFFYSYWYKSIYMKYLK